MKMPVVTMIEWVKGNVIRIFYSSERVIEIAIPGVKDARKAKIANEGIAIKVGGQEIDTLMLLGMRNKVLLEGRKGWMTKP